LLAWLRQIMPHCLLNLLRRPEFPTDLAPLLSHYRLAIELRHFDRLGLKEIGAVLGCSGEAARKVWSHAQAKLGLFFQTGFS
jgi:DNA-directed RNA polymerase specialized sigma24 family protein